MAVHENLTVAHHQQDTGYYCGPACEQMVLDSIGAGILNQADLYNDGRNHTSESSAWYTPPDGMQWVMNNRHPGTFTGWFALDALSTEDAISRMLAWTIHHYQVAPIALVLGGNHWVVVRGYEASAAPSSSTDTTYGITAFEINNPAPPTPQPGPPPPHSAGDGCGSGGNRGVANQHIAYATWQSTYMTGNGFGTAWNGKNIAVCDPDPPPERPGRVERIRRPLPGDRILQPEGAIEYALAGLRHFGLPERKGWDRALKDAKPGKPVLVQRLDQLDSFYYIVPLEKGRGTVSAAVAVDARFGDYREAIGVPEVGSDVFAALDPRAARELIVGRRYHLEGNRGSIVLHEEAFSLAPTLVWRPCLESLSTFYPFYMAALGDQRVYIRIDGAIFTKLHWDIGGI